VVQREAIFRELWGGEWYGSPKAIDVHVAALRRKLGDAAWIETSRSVGFRLREPG
jgi:DNA-binding response OmpR family regulator